MIAHFYIKVMSINIWLRVAGMGALVMGMSVACSLAAAEFRVADFGAKGDGESDDGPAVRRAVAAAVEAGPGSTVIFEPKVYRFGRFGRGAQPQISIQGASGITIEGNGAAIMNNPYNGFISIVNSSEVIMRGFYFDCDPLGFTQGDVVRTSPSQHLIWVRIHEGYDNPLDVSEYPERRLWEYGFTIDPKDRTQKGRPGVDYINLDETTEEEGLLRIKLNPHSLSYIVEGDFFVMGITYGGGSPTISVSRSSDILLENYTIFSAKYGMVHHLSNNHGRVIARNAKITFRPGKDRLITAVRDGFHCKHNPIGPVIEEGMFEGLMDDTINISVTPYWVIEDLGDHRYLIADLSNAPRVGDRLMAYNPDPGSVSDDLKVLSIEPQQGRGRGQWNIVTLDQPIPNLVLHEGDNLFPGGRHKMKFTGLYNLDAAGKDFIVRNNYFGHQRRHALLARTTGGLFEGNEIEGVGGSGIALVNEVGNFYEGPLPGHAIIRNNTFRRTNLHPIRIYAQGEGTRVENITIENNRFFEWAHAAVHVSRIDGGAITGNVFGPSRDNSPRSQAIIADESRGIVIRGNRHQSESR